MAPAGQLTLHVKYQVAPENVDTFLKALRPTWESVTNEEENLFFDVFQSHSEPGVIRFVEVWSKDAKWLMEVQAQKDYYKPYFEATKPLLVSEPEIAIFERKEGWSVVKDGYLDGALKK